MGIVFGEQKNDLVVVVIFELKDRPKFLRRQGEESIAWASETLHFLSI